MNVKALCLGALCLNEGTGYDIKKLFEAAFNHFHGASYGSIYPALKQLEEAGLVSHSIEPGGKHPDRKLYNITEEGRAAFIEELAQTPPSEHLRSEFMVLLFFAHLLPTKVLESRLDQALEAYRDELNYLRSIASLPTHTSGISCTIDLGIEVLQTKIRFFEQRRGQLLETHKKLPLADMNRYKKGNEQ